VVVRIAAAPDRILVADSHWLEHCIAVADIALAVAGIVPVVVDTALEAVDTALVVAGIVPVVVDTALAAVDIALAAVDIALAAVDIALVVAGIGLAAVDTAVAPERELARVLEPVPAVAEHKTVARNHLLELSQQLKGLAQRM
jgi:hypothetical protein